MYIHVCTHRWLSSIRAVHVPVPLRYSQLSQTRSLYQLWQVKSELSVIDWLHPWSLSSALLVACDIYLYVDSALFRRWSFLARSFLSLFYGSLTLFQILSVIDNFASVVHDFWNDQLECIREKAIYPILRSGIWPVRPLRYEVKFFGTWFAVLTTRFVWNYSLLNFRSLLKFFNIEVALFINKRLHFRVVTYQSTIYILT
jgi:hypothetical protein